MDEAGKLQEVKRAAQDFVARQDLRTTRVAVVGFGSRAHLESPLSSDPGQLRQAIERIADGGGTMMAEGLEAGLQALGEADTPARSLLLFTDGMPGSTTVSPRVASRAALSAAERARAQGVRLVAVATEDADRAFLERLTGSSELVFSTTAGQFGEAFRQADRAIRQLFGGPASSSLAQVLWETFLRGALARLAGFAVLGAFVGMMVQWAQQAFKSAWLVGVGSGPYEGKEYILAKPVVTVGRSDANDIGLYRERDLPLKAGVLRLEQGVWRWEGQPVPVNGVVTPRQALRPGDRLRLGTAEFLFQARGAQPPEALDAWALQGNTQTHPLPFPLRQATLGSDPRCTVVIRGQRVAPRQAEIRAGAQGLELLALAEGVQVNGEALPQGQRRGLEPGDLLTLGAEEFALIRRRG
ncbi:Inner membrane component of T3SS, cytoplasmic domain [Calidithermus terrae]|uniref:Inner membrane component of T3SS, cytoplasmic domain n=2 Tax=Calidithermus terrae TaxID=1408545 RepID=A0A399DQ48_9DEIN|nr:Inner membrane component of T3SS, cytoplasmic domain [Calidithermus terrae]